MPATESRVSSDNLVSDIWWIILLEGITFALLGLWILTSPGISVVTLVQLIGIYWLISGIYHIVEIFIINNSTSKVWLGISGLIGILAGVAVLNHPFTGAYVASVGVVLVIAILGIVLGVVNIVRTFRGGGVGSLILGLIYGLIGLALIYNPIGGAATLIYIIGFLALLGGGALIIVSFSARNELKAENPKGA